MMTIIPAKGPDQVLTRKYRTCEFYHYGEQKPKKTKKVDTLISQSK